jgi:hypothetical protein
VRCLRLELSSRLVEIDLLLSKSQRVAITKSDQLHAKSGSIKGDCCLDVGYCEHEVIEMIDSEIHTPSMQSIAWGRWGRSMTINLVIAGSKRVPVILNQRRRHGWIAEVGVAVRIWGRSL